MKKVLLFAMALCCSAVMFAGGDIFEAWVTYSVNDEALDAHFVGKNTEEAPDVNLGTVSKFFIDSFFVKVWQDNGDHFDKVYAHYRYGSEGAIQNVEMKWKRDLEENNREWGGEVKLDIADPCVDGDHSLEVWFSGELNPNEQAKYLSNNNKNYKFNFTKGTPAPKVWSIIGNFNDWKSGYEMEEDENGSLNVQIPVEAKSNYEFKIISASGKDTVWYGLPSEGNVMKYGSSTDWKAFKTKGDENKWNVGLRTTEAGNYTFSVDKSKQAEGELSFSVAIPEPAPDTREKREIVFVPGGVKSNNPAMFVHAFTKGKESFHAKMDVKKEGEDTVCYTAQIPKELDSLIFVRAATEVVDWDNINWGEGGNVWNQTEDQKIECDTASFVDWVYETKYFKVCWCGDCEKPIPAGAILFKSKAFNYAANMPFEKGEGDEYRIKVTYEKAQVDEFIIVTSEKLYKIAADAETMHRENCTDWGLVEDGENTKDVAINIDAPGEYTYIWKPADLKISVIYPDYKILGDEYFIKLPVSEGDWVWHDMEKDVDTNLWSFATQWQDGGADIGTGKADSSPHKYFAEDAIDFGENKVKPEVGTDCKYIWNPAEQKLSVEYKKQEGIENVAYELDLNAPMYNLLGVEVDAAFHGVVIQNGHKYIR